MLTDQCQLTAVLLLQFSQHFVPCQARTLWNFILQEKITAVYMNVRTSLQNIF